MQENRDQEMEGMPENLDLNIKKSAKPMTSVPDLAFDVDRLKIYYESIFPYRLFFKWLSYNQIKNKHAKSLQSLDSGNDSDIFRKREFSFTLENDVYCRYLDFANAEDFKESLVQRTPFKIDIGAVFNQPPSAHLTVQKQAFVPEQKEMVFDIDMTDYDDVRTCCKGAQVCKKCWKFMAIATQIMDNTLRNDFGFKSLLWVFSGRRGIHCWVCDSSARFLLNEGRSAVTDYCNLGVGNEQAGKLKIQHPLHPMLERTFRALYPKQFEEVVILEQDLLAVEKHRVAFIAALPEDEGLRHAVRSIFSMDITNMEKWQRYKQKYEEWKSTMPDSMTKKGKQDQVNPRSFDTSMQNLVFTYLYPRLDANVSRGINHLLKSPFCVHPKTGKVCVPFDPKNVFYFDLEGVATLGIAVQDLAEFKRQGQENDTQGAAVGIRCLEESIAVFKEFLKTIQQENVVIKKK